MLKLSGRKNNLLYLLYRVCSDLDPESFSYEELKEEFNVRREPGVGSMRDGEITGDYRVTRNGLKKMLENGWVAEVSGGAYAVESVGWEALGEFELKFNLPEIRDERSSARLANRRFGKDDYVTPGGQRPPDGIRPSVLEKLRS